MPTPIRQAPTTLSSAAALQVLEQMYAYYAFDWQPFAPAQAIAVKQAA